MYGHHNNNFQRDKSVHLLLLIRIKSNTVVLYLKRGPKFLLINLSILRWNLSNTYHCHILCNYILDSPQLILSDQEICKVFNDKELLHQGSRHTKRIIKVQHLHYSSVFFHAVNRHTSAWVWMDKTINHDWTNTYIHRGPVLTKHAAKHICI